MVKVKFDHTHPLGHNCDCVECVQITETQKTPIFQRFDFWREQTSLQLAFLMNKPEWSKTFSIHYKQYLICKTKVSIATDTSEILFRPICETKLINYEGL